MPVRLIVRRPSPTTVSFTVSNAPDRSSPSARILFYLQTILRALCFTCVLFICSAKLRHSFFAENGLIVYWHDLWGSPLGSFVCRIVDSCHLGAIFVVSAVAIYAVFRKESTEESLLVIRGLGIQTSSSSATYLSTATTRFIPTTQIQDIVIHEAFKGFEVRFYLAVIVEGEPTVVVVFPKLLPRRKILEDVWRGSRHCLYDAKS
ncbi:hypothetical protein MPDQ_005370 [Monascus purpureus]|uniref:Phosphatidylinositol N-acetylglucosaminyltransferase subunit H conserved domain-containing protein n=1 Tax=Monascus purpureus TaxID=5098 RepID=A0A507R125_MONPU|nr:hypothetical protein MPDQ_005370 [Monascus purpureus]BDD60055.1 hypothetical protein MAP00_005219 [Monascus purpureus]